MRRHWLQPQARQPPEHLGPDPPPPQRAVDEKLKHRQRHQRVPPARGDQMPVHASPDVGANGKPPKPQTTTWLAASAMPSSSISGTTASLCLTACATMPSNLFLLVRDPAVGHELVDDEPGPLVQRRIGQEQQRDRDQQARVNAPVDGERVSDHHARRQRRDQQRPPGHGDEHDARAQVVDPPVSAASSRSAAAARRAARRRPGRNLVPRTSRGTWGRGQRIARAAGRFSDRLTPAEAGFTTARARLRALNRSGTGARRPPRGAALPAGRPRRRATPSARAASR